MEKEMQIEKQGSMKIDGSRFFPDETVREILSRLPVKSLLRCMSVSKNWKSLISHHSFIKLHHQRSLNNNNNNNPPSMLVLHYYDNNPVLTTFDLVEEVVQQWSLPYSNLEMLPFPSQSKLVCFTDGQRFFLCNPSTRQLASLPGLSFDPCFCGFGYVPSNDEYLIVNLFQTNPSTNFDCEVLTLSISNDDEQVRYKAWRSIEAMDIRKVCDQWGVFVCGAFYWTIIDRDGNKALLSFDIENEVFSIIRMPLDFQYLYRSYMLPLEIKGELYVMSVSSRPDTLNLWKLSDVKNQLWTQSFEDSFGSSCNSPEFNREILMNRLKHLHYHNKPYNYISRYIIRNLRIGNRVIRPWGIGIYTSLFSL